MFSFQVRPPERSSDHLLRANQSANHWSANLLSMDTSLDTGIWIPAIAIPCACTVHSPKRGKRNSGDTESTTGGGGKRATRVLEIVIARPIERVSTIRFYREHPPSKKVKRGSVMLAKA